MSDDDDDRAVRPPPSDPYLVGYRKPPREHRFKPGNRAAAKRGRPPKTRKAVIDKVMSEPMEVTQGGRTMRMSKFEVLVRRLLQRAMNDDDKAIDRLIKLGLKLEVAVPPESADTHDYGAEIRAKIESMAERLAAAKRLGLPEK